MKSTFPLPLLGLLLLAACVACTSRGTLGIEPQPSEGGAPGDTPPLSSAGAPEAGAPNVSSACGDLAGVPLMQLDNAADCEVLTYPLAFLSGTTSTSESEVVVELAGESRSWPVFDGRFKALVKLARGTNLLRFDVGGETRALHLTYEPPAPPSKLVRLFVYLGSDGAGSLDAPPGVVTTLDDALARVSLDGLLWQSFFAESFRRSRARQLGRDVPRRTFQLELDADDDPVVHVIRHDSMTEQQLRERNSGLDDWGDVVRLVNQQTEWPVADSLHIGYSLVTHLDVANLCAGNGDPSGGGVGMCGGGNLITHAASLDDVVQSFSDSAQTDPTYIAEDSQMRGTYWAAYATTLGCALEEGLRGLGLPYAAGGLFSPDCGHINRFFMPFEVAPGGERVPVTPHTETELGPDWFDAQIASELDQSPFVQ